MSRQEEQTEACLVMFRFMVVVVGVHTYLGRNYRDISTTHRLSVCYHIYWNQVYPALISSVHSMESAL